MAGEWMTEPVLARLIELARSGGGNLPISVALAKEFKIHITPGMVAGKVYKLGIKRGGPSQGSGANFRAMLDLCPGDSPSWLSPEGDVLMKRATQCSIKHRDIADFFGISTSSVSFRIGQMGRRERALLLANAPGEEIPPPTAEQLQMFVSREWSLEQLFALCKSRNADLGRKETAVAIRQTPHAVAAKIRRLCAAGILAYRPAPQPKRDGPRKERVRLPKPVLAPLASVTAAIALEPVPAVPRPSWVHPSVNLFRLPTAPRVPVTPRPNDGRVGPCQWPLNDGAPRWLFCEAPSAAGRPYCHEHCRVAYNGYREAA